jgi:hypothetical protein
MRLPFLLLCTLLSLAACAQPSLRPFHVQYEFRPAGAFFRNDTLPNAARKGWVTGIAAGGYAVSALYLGLNWYANEPLGPFRFFNDAHEWQQIDKAGHALGAYHASTWMTGLYKWSGAPKRKAILTGSLAGFLAMSSIEVFDGFGETWGFSWPDIGANALGAGFAALNQGLWNENRLQLKMGWRPSPFARTDSLERLFGSSPVEWLLKDYNGQTYWLSVRVHSFLPDGAFRDHYPRWLNLAVGYGAEGMIGRYGIDPEEAIRAREYRQLYLSLDLDLSNIRTRSGFLHTLFNTVSILRVPFPAIRLDRNGLVLRAFE